MYRQMKKATNYVKVLVKSESVERFLNMCRFKHLYFWDIEANSEGFSGYISKVEFMQLKEICQKTESRIRVIKRKGIGFLMFKYRKHYSFVVGIFMAFILLYMCSLFVWNISFTGNCKYTDDFLKKKLKMSGVSFGMRISDVDCSALEREIRSSFSEITWVSAEISGTKLIVHIKENDGASQIMETKQEPRDIVATQDGVIAQIITRKGTPKVKKGDNVVKGQILVSGVIDVKDDSGTVVSKMYTASDADILISTELEYKDELPVEYTKKNYTGKTKTKSLLNIFGCDIEIGWIFSNYKDFDVVTQSKQLKLGADFCLPVYYGKKCYYEYENQVQKYSEEEAKSILTSNFYKYTQTLLENEVQIIRYNVKMDTSNVCYTYDGLIQVKTPAFDYTAVTNENEVKEESN